MDSKNEKSFNYLKWIFILGFFIATISQINRFGLSDVQQQGILALIGYLLLKIEKNT
jgi:hypothetical protein